MYINSFAADFFFFHPLFDLGTYYTSSENKVLLLMELYAFVVKVSASQLRNYKFKKDSGTTQSLES